MSDIRIPDWIKERELLKEMKREGSLLKQAKALVSQIDKDLFEL